MKKINLRVLSVILTVCMMAQFVPASVYDMTAKAVGEQYVFAGAPGKATIENDGWQLNLEETAPAFYFNRNVTSWFEDRRDCSLLWLDNINRDRIAYELNVETAGYYDMTVTTANVKGDYDIYVNGNKVGKIASGATTSSMSGVRFNEGLNTFRIQGTAGWMYLYKVDLSFTSEALAEEISFDFTSDDVIPDIHRMTFANQGMRFSQHMSSGLYAGFTDFSGNNGYGRICFNERVGNYAGFDFIANEAGNHDIIVMAENNANHSAELEAIVNGTNSKAVNGVTVGTFDTSHEKGRKAENHRAVHLAGTADLNEGYNVLQFKSVGTPKGINALYFREGIALAESTPAATITGGNLSFSKDIATAVTVKAPAHGLYFLYIKGKVSANGFGGDVSVGGMSQYIDFNTAYYNEAADKEVVRVVGPVWMDAEKDTAVNFTEKNAESTALNLSAIELHRVEQNLWMRDGANQNFAGATLKTHGWELDAGTTDKLYNRMILGSETVNNASSIYYSGAYRDASGTNIDLSEGDVKFLIDIPVSGKYSLTGMFGRNPQAGIIDFAIEEADFEKRLELYSTLDSGVTEEQIGNIRLEKGVYTLKITGVDSSDITASGLFMNSLTFKPVLAPTGVRVNINSTHLTVGEKADIFADVAMSDGTVVALPVLEAASGENGIVMASSDTDIATVVNGVITAVSEGSADIEVTAYMDGDVLKEIIPITVSAKAGDSEFALIADNAFPIRVKERRDILLHGTISNVICDLSKADKIEVTSSDEDIASGEVIFRNGKSYVRVYAHAEGDAEISVSAELGGMKADAVIPVSGAENVESTMYTLINFALSSISDFKNLKTDLHGWKISEKTDQIFWDRVNAGHTVLRSGRDTLINFGWENGKGHEVYFDIKVDKTGWYALSFTGQQHMHYGAVTEMSIDGEFVGEFNFCDPDGEDDSIPRHEERFRDMYLTEGIHVLKVERINAPAGDGHSIAYMHNLKLTPIKEPVRVAGINVDCSADKLIPGDTEKVSYSLRLADGTDYHFPKLTQNQGGISMEAVTPQRASLNGNTVAAKAGGAAIFKLLAQRPGEQEYSGQWQINVTAGQVFDFTAFGALDAEKANIAKHNWRVDSEKTADSIENASVFNLSNDKGFCAQFNENDVLALDLNMLKGSAYDVDIVYSQVADTGCRAGVYMNDTYLGEVDFSSDDGEKSENGIRMLLNSVELEAGSNTLYIKRLSSDGGNMMYINRIVFSTADKMPEVDRIAIDAPANEIVYRETMQVSASVIMDNGRELHFGNKLDGSADENNKVEYVSENNDVFTVDASGLMTGVWTGKADLTVKATVAGERYEEKRLFETIRILKPAAMDDLFLTRTEKASTELTATIDGESFDLFERTAEGDIWAVGAAGGSVSAEIKRDDEQKKVYLVVEGHRAGASSVTVYVTVEGVTGSVEIPVQVYAPSETKWDPDLDFVPGYSGAPDSAIITADGWCVNYEKTSPGVAGGALWNLNSAGLCVNLANQYTKMVIDYMVKEDGYYSLDLIGNQRGNYGATVALFFDDMYLGEFSFAHPTDDVNQSNRDVRKALNSLYMSPGTHNITIERINDGNYRHSFIYLLGLDFTKLEGELSFKESNASVGSTNLCVGESTEIFTQAVMSDGSIRNFGNLMNGVADSANNITVTNSDPSVAEIRNGRLYAKAAGITVITVTATVDGVEKTSQVIVDVDLGEIESVTAELAEPVVYVGKSVGLNVEAYAAGGRKIDNASLEIEYSSSDEGVAKVENGVITGVGVGTATIGVTAKLNGKEVYDLIDVEVTEDGITGITVSALPRLIKPTSEGTQIQVSGGSFHGKPINLDIATIKYSTAATDIIDLSATGYVKPKKLGSAEVTVTVEADVEGYKFTAEDTITIIVTDGKVGRTFYTDSKVEAARENINTYAWAKSEAAAIIKEADKFLEKEDILWEAVTTQELPRGTWVGYRYDPWGRYCRYCNADLTLLYSNPIYAYNIDVLSSPWKMQCKSCRRKFPSNDFGSFYELGIVKGGKTTDAYGNTVNNPGGYWSYELAHENHFNLFIDEYTAAGYATYAEYDAARKAGVRLPAIGYLKNDMYPEVDTVSTVNHGNGMFATETVEGWGVDDGYGYRTGYVHKNTNAGDVADVHTYIAAYNRSVMGTDYLFDTVAKTLSQAYLFTGDKKYGRVCAIALDRLADVYPDMDIAPFIMYYNSGEIGKLEGRIWENDTPQKWAQAYDAVWDMYDDPEVISYLSQKAAEYNMENDKSTPEKIRQNIEDGILREIYKGLPKGQLHGNFGLHQVPLTVAAIVLDNEKESTEMFDYLMRYDEYHLFPTGTIHTGGEILHKLYNDVDRDGGTKEGMSPNYQNLWYNTMANIAQMLSEYENYNGVDMYTHPKLRKMIKNQFNYIMCRRGSLPIGDSSVMASLELITPSPIHFMNMYYATGDYEFLQMLYFINGNKTDGLNLEIWSKDPEKVQRDMRDVINKYGEYDLDNSRMVPATGFLLLRDGSLYGKGSPTEKDTQRDFWMGFGLTGVHGHRDTLGIGLHAYGLDFAPDFGYPNPSNLDDQHRNWGMSPLSHNLIIVDDQAHSSLSVPGTPLHFDDAGRVKVMEAENPAVSPSVDIYRRAVVMVEVDDDISYGVDFFRVKGGNEHLYSFHAQSHEIGKWAGFTPIKQEGGSYAGADIPYETQGYTNGYTYLTNVRRDNELQTGEIMVEFDITDYRKAIKDSSDMHLRLTMLNDFNLSDVSLAKGVPPKKNGNPDWIEFLLARRSGTDLDSTFTTLLEPYKGEPNITSSEQVSVRRADGKELSEGEIVRAIKVGVRDSRYDYVVYASDNNVDYIIDEHINFRGFIGVCTEDLDGNVVYSYVNHGTTMADAAGASEYTGAVVDFTRDPLEVENTITVSLDVVNAEASELNGRYIYVENDGAQNAVYPIETARANDDGTVTLFIGNNTLVREATNITSSSADCTYNISPGQWFTIPMSTSADSSPKFVTVDDASVAAGNTFKTTVSAESPINKDITYTATSMPRGATFNPTTREIQWVPDNTQIGEHHFIITADDGNLKSALHFTVTVHKSISGGSSGSGIGDGSSGGSSGADNVVDGGNNTDTPSTGGTPGGAGGGGGGASSGGNAETDKPSDTDKPESDEQGGGTAESEQFTDLGNHSWAKEAIYALVEKGVVKGTSGNTYSPANNIKRADFAIMLTRAFGITEGDSEQFADVDASKYYAEELRLAKSAGIVAGVGENKFNPDGEISRQDMMVMLYRALKAQGYELSDPDHSVLAEFADAATIADYAKDAASVLVKDGIIGGSNNKISPLAKATRAEIAVMLSRSVKAE